MPHVPPRSSTARTVPLRAITERRDLGLRTVVAAPGTAPQVRWALVSELADPVPYLRGSELLLTAGVDMSTRPADVRAYVAGLVRAGVGALGFGVTPVHDRLPPALVDECRAQGLPLVEVPRQTPFVAVSQAVGEALEELHVQDLRRMGEAHRALARAVTAPSPVERLVGTLARALGGWAALAAESVITRAEPVPPLSDEVVELLEKLRRPSGPRSAKARMGEDEVALHAVGGPGGSGEVLIVGRTAPLDPTDRAVLGTAVALLGLLSHTRSGAERSPGRTIARLLLDPEPGADLAPALASLAGRTADGASATGTGTGAEAGTAIRFRALRARWTGRGPAPHAAALAAVAGTELVDPGEGELRAVLADRGDATAHRAELDRLHSAGWLAALSAPAEPRDLADADRTAAALLVRATAVGSPLIWPDASDPLAEAIEPDRARTAARTILGPLADTTDTARGLRTTLHTWLARHGNWDRTAADLGSHRNSVRYRIGRIERDLGVDLADPEQRMRLWFALTRWDAPL
ncbi:PucR family transcriptional regulator [Nocardiopsis gilva YIM 90087]|uniref:PucR family transcriptional regulator n=1 Tax=Nocardiopsis gilva YIM 90087 TaxID=1235441 RepID=A0A223S6U4_9ACTN|nr:PucR family transcriptional regulator [Nocardiopsis gilva]ASU83823.1 PucR family transcriptional regulator [Nocardiopsis gilva YIM 90087]